MVFQHGHIQLVCLLYFLAHRVIIFLETLLESEGRMESHELEERVLIIGEEIFVIGIGLHLKNVIMIIVIEGVH